MADDSLELEGYVHVDVLVEARLYGAEGRQRRPVVAAARGAGAQLRLSPRQLLRFALQLLLSPL